jgi:hypothetical protein
MNSDGRGQSADGGSLLPSAIRPLPSVKRDRFAFALIALVATMIFIAPLVRQEVFTVRDHFDYFQPLRWFTAQELRAGHLPLWNPYNASGEPWLANPQTGVFYPPAWLFLALPFATAYMLFLLFHLILLGWGAYLLFARGASPGAAMFGAIVLMLSGPVLSLLDINNNLASLAWIPLVLWCAAERTPIRGGFALALAFLGGEPFLAGVAAVMYVAVSLAADRRSRLSLRNSSGQNAVGPAGSPVLHVLVAALVAFGVSAIQLFPFLQLLAGSDRAVGMSKELILRDSMPLRDWLRVALPPSLEAGAFDPRLGQHFIPVVYMSIIVVALALIGLTRARRMIGWLALLAVAMVFASGPALLARLPLTVMRYPARVVPLAALAVIALAVAGWDRVRRDRRWLDLVLILIVVADLLLRARPLLATAPFRTDVVPYAHEIGADSKILRVGDTESAHRALWISGYLNLYDRRFDAYTAAPVTNERYLRFYRRVIEHPSREVLNALPAGYVVTSLALPPPFEAVARAANVTVFRNRDAHPLAVLMTREKMSLAHAQIATSHARVIVDAPKGGVVVLAQQDAPSWRVEVDGKSAEKHRIYGLFLGVDVPKGHHEVTWTYRSETLFTGAAMTLVTLLSIQLLLFVKRRR